ncbi:unnamed protein product [Durusdinium trenchii]|uniref:Uncharacterized protein n=2 Tax=Durusdinium trenchii TaxID=1381693 RepID=A0ABP0PHV6_9DINO
MEENFDSFSSILDLEELAPVDLTETVDLTGGLTRQEFNHPHGEQEYDASLVGGETVVSQDVRIERFNELESQHSNSCINTVVETSVWNSMIASAYDRYRAREATLSFPWEVGASAEIFQSNLGLSLPSISSFSIQPPAAVDRASESVPEMFGSDIQPGVCYVHAVSDMKDLDYFEDKRLKLELACGKWMNLLSCSWDASIIGMQLCRDLRVDPSGKEATESLRACFGTKSPSTVLKRAATMKKFVTWHYEEFESRGVFVSPFPLTEQDVWAVFLHLRDERVRTSKGFTTPATFLETVRFCKFTVGLQGCDAILQSGRLLGFAAIERREKGPTKQAPILELVHLRRLHEILAIGSDPVDQLGAGAMLVCIYARARWSDLRYVHRVELEKGRNGAMVIYTQEHKTSAVGLRREQYLPLVVPWEGVISGDWISLFTQVYERLGLELHKVPLGPLIPVIEQAIELVADEEDRLSAKEEMEEVQNYASFAGDLSLFGEEAVSKGYVQIESSSESEDTSDSVSSSNDDQERWREADAYQELVPEGETFHKHTKTSRLHRVKDNKSSTECGKKLSENFRELGRVLTFRFPKCLICFPQAEGRFRTREQVVARLDEALKRARH